MKKDTPIVLAVATYADRASAVEDYHAIRKHKHKGEYDHLAIAVLTRDAAGGMQVERHDSTAKHLAWGGLLVGAGLVVLAPAAAPITFLASVGVGGGATGAGLAGLGGLTGHFWHNIPKDRVREMSDLLEAGESALVVVATDKKGNDIEPLFVHATKCIVDDTTKGDLEAAYNDAVSQAEATVAD